jgi:hypothetical protein
LGDRIRSEAGKSIEAVPLGARLREGRVYLLLEVELKALKEVFEKERNELAGELKTLVTIVVFIVEL